MSLSKLDIFKRKTKISKVFIDSLGADVYVREFIVSERNELRKTDGLDFQHISLILGVCDEEGVALFELKDIPEMEKMPQKVSDELLMAVVDHNENKDSKSTAKN